MRNAHNLTPMRVMTVASMILAYGGCAYRTEDGAARLAHRFAQQPEAAARCFARNAEKHSSALIAEVSGARDIYDVAVNVRNGSPYATAHIERAGTGARGIIELNVQSSRGTRELLDALVDGC